MLTPLAHMRPSGGFLSEIINIIKVLEGFLRGHIEAMLIIGSQSGNEQFLVIPEKSFFATPLMKYQ